MGLGHVGLPAWAKDIILVRAILELKVAENGLKHPDMCLGSAVSWLHWRSAGKWCFKLLTFLIKLWRVPLLALASFILTILYALYSKAISSDPIIGGSQSGAIRTFSASSILTTHIFPAATINASFDNFKEWLIVRRQLGDLEDLAFRVHLRWTSSSLFSVSIESKSG
jgi:hypothetical protein